MDHRPGRRLGVLLCALIAAIIWSTPAFSQADDRQVELQRQYDAVNAELKALTAELPAITAQGTPIATREEYVARIFELRALLKSLEERLKPEEETPPPLKLVRVIGPKGTGCRGNWALGKGTYDYNPGSNGYTARSCSKTHEWTLSFMVTYAPLEIVPGRPFHMEAQVKFRYGRVRYPSGRSECWGRPVRTGTSFAAAPFYGSAASRSDVQCGGDTTANLSFRLIPVNQRYDKVYKIWRTVYRYQLASDGINVRGHNSMDNTKTREIHSFNYPPSSDLPGRYGFEIKAQVPWHPDIKFIYRALRPGERAITGLGHYRHPALFDRPLRDEQGGDEVAAKEEKGGQEGAGGETPGAGGSGTETAGASSEEGAEGTGAAAAGGAGTGGAGTAGTGTGAQVAGLPKPAAIDPNRPRIKALIKEWISVAEPPPNATKGADLRYDEWGDTVGRGAGYTTTRRSKPDNAGGLTPTEFVWQERIYIDSVDHCRLGEFVVARLRGDGTGHCRGRYKRAAVTVAGVGIPNVVGLKAAIAKARLEKSGFKVVPRPAGPAPSKNKEFTVQSQTPKGGRAKRGTSVTLRIHPKFVSLTWVPDVTGMTGTAAKARLERWGFKVRRLPGGPAPSQDRDFAVRRQAPAPGTRLKRGAEVRITVYSSHVRMVTVPNFIGANVDGAISRLRALGLKTRRRGGGDAPSRRKAFTVTYQNPKSNARIKAGTTVTLSAYGAYVRLITLPDLAGQSYRAASANLKVLGLKVRRQDVGRAPSRRQAFTVARQRPRAKTRVKAGTTVMLSAYSSYVPTRSEMVRAMQRECARVRGGEAYWDSRRQAASCRCPAGMTPNRSGTACVRPIARPAMREFPPGPGVAGRGGTGSGPSAECRYELMAISAMVARGDMAAARGLANGSRTRRLCSPAHVDQALGGAARSQGAQACSAALAEIRRRMGSSDYLGATSIANDRRTRAACPRREIDQALRTPPGRRPGTEPQRRRDTGKFTGCRWVSVTRPGFGPGSAHDCRCDQGTIRSTPERFCGQPPAPRVTRPRQTIPPKTTSECKNVCVKWFCSPWGTQCNEYGDTCQGAVYLPLSRACK